MAEPTNQELQQSLVDMSQSCSITMKVAADQQPLGDFKNQLILFSEELEKIAIKLDNRINRKDGYIGE